MDYLIGEMEEELDKGLERGECRRGVREGLGEWEDTAGITAGRREYGWR